MTYSLFLIYSNGRRELNDRTNGRWEMKGVKAWAKQRQGDGASRIEVIDDLSGEIVFECNGETENKASAFPRHA